jgi:hypothetical protein
LLANSFSEHWICDLPSIAESFAQDRKKIINQNLVKIVATQAIVARAGADLDDAVEDIEY